MFVQMIQGQVADAGALRTALDQWYRDLAPGATGWLGSTSGVTEDGRSITIVRFESEEAARANSDRTEQSAWWAEVSKLFTTTPTFDESTDVVLDLVGDPNQAGFVQVMRGTGTNPERARELMSAGSDEWAAFRPDVLASVAVMHPEGRYTMVVYFTSEAEAREGEKKEPPEAIKAQMEEMNALQTGVPEFFDLKDPWMLPPQG